MSKKYDRYKYNEEALNLIKKPILNEKDKEKILDLYNGSKYSFNNSEYYTPNFVIDFLVDYINVFISKDANINVLEPSCGNGKMIYKFKNRFKNAYYTGIEINNNSYSIAKTVLNDSNISILNNDFLELNINNYKNKYDLIIGNPPFGKCKIKYDNNYYKKHLKNNYCCMFMYKCLDMLRPGGHLLMVIDTSVCGNEQYKDFRKEILENNYILAGISLPNHTFYFSETSCSTQIMHLVKKKEGIDLKDYKILMAIVNEIPFDKRGRKTSKNDLNNILINVQDYYKEEHENINRINIYS